VAALDCGTNSTRLLILDHDGSVLRRDNVITRLGDRVDSSGQLADDAQERVADTVRHFAVTLHDYGVERARLVGTSAIRQAANGGAFMAYLHDILGHPCDVISGNDEARLSFMGARGALPDVISDTTLVFDIGGGSTEFCRLSDGELVTASVPVGCVRFEERWGTDLDGGRREIRDVLDELVSGDDRWASPSPTAVGLAGTMATLVHLELGADDPDPRYPGWHFSSRVATMWREILAPETNEQRAAHRGMRAGREGVMVAGLVILEEICAHWHILELVAGEADILDGVAGELRSN
jgi:exopolyphosphatase/guanosine-5'-triphosphate,3'-diphosphate pyrophosphatase